MPFRFQNVIPTVLCDVFHLISGKRVSYIPPLRTSGPARAFHGTLTPDITGKTLPSDKSVSLTVLFLIIMIAHFPWLAYLHDGDLGRVRVRW